MRWRDGGWPLCVDLLARRGVGEVQASDGTDLHQVPEASRGVGCARPDVVARRIDDRLHRPRGDRSGIYTVNVDGTDLHQVTAVEDPQTPDWGPAPA